MANSNWTNLGGKALLIGCLIFAATPLRAQQSDIIAEQWKDGAFATGEYQATGAEHTITFSHPAPPTSTWNQPWEDHAALLSKLTDGELEVKVMGSGTLHGAKDGFKAVGSGLSDWATCYAAFEGRGFELTRVNELPFLMDARATVNARILNELAPKYFAPEFEARGVKFGYYAAFPAYNLMSSKPVRSWEDLKGLRIVAQGFPQAVAEAMGATFLNIPYTEVYTAMQQGLADAMFWNDAGFVPYRIYEVAKYYTRVGISSGGIPTCYNEAKINSLPDAISAVFIDSLEGGAMYGSFQSGVVWGRTAEQSLEEAGVQFIDLADEEHARWVEKLEPVVEEWMAELESKGKPARALVEDVRTLRAKYTEMSDEELLEMAFGAD